MRCICGWLLLWLICSVAACLRPVAALEKLEYAPASAQNPLKGFVPYTESGDAFPHSMEWFYLPLKDLQIGEDRFTWKALDARLDAIARRGHQAVFRVYLDYPDTEYGVPAFLAQVARHPYTDHGNGTHHTSYSPDYADPALRRALTHFITALGRRYDGDPRIGFLTVGLLGYWGEWHTYPHSDWFASTSVQNEILDAFTQAFPRTKLLMREPKSGTNAAHRALGYHDDSFAYETLGPPDWHFWGKVAAQGAAEKWKTEAIGGELRPEVQKCIWDDAPCNPPGQEFGLCVRTTHASWLLNQGAFNGLKGPQRDRALAAARQMGYEFFVSQAEIQLSSGQLQTTLYVRNTGVAPFYYDWKVRFGLLDASGKLVQTWDADAKLTGILPGAPDTVWKWKGVIKTLKAGRYTLLVQIANPLPTGSPVRFANAAQDRDLIGWLTFGRGMRQLPEGR